MTERCNNSVSQHGHRFRQTKVHHRNLKVFGVGQTDATSDTTLHEPNAQARRKSIPKSAIPDAKNSDRTSHRPSFSLAKMAEETRSKKVRFYRNGDRFFKGMVIAVSTQRFRTFESLLNSLTISRVCDGKFMPSGVRHIFTSDGARRVDSLDELEDGESYVCASTDVFRSLNYSRNESPVWNRDVVMNGTSHRKLNHSQLQKQHLQQQRQLLHDREATTKPRTLSSRSQSVHNTAVEDSTPDSERLKSSQSAMTPSDKATYEGYMRSFVVPRLITVVRQGKKPRKSVRLLLNSKTAKTIDQVLEDIAESVKLDCGNIKKLYTLSGRRVSCLRDFFEQDSIFLACGMEKPGPDDFLLGPREVRQVYAYRSPHVQGKKTRVTLHTPHESSRSRTSAASTGSTTRSLSGSSSKKSGDTDISSNSGATVVNKDDKPNLPMPLTLTNKYEVGNVLGTGNFAVVFECREKKSKKMFALKIIDTDSCKDRTKMIDNEVRILRRLNHPNIIRLIEDYSFQQRVFYVMDLIKGGDLFDAICLSRKYTEQDAGSIVFNLASALHYLHSLRIAHRDVKPENILIRLFDDGTKSLKLGDFGLATEVKSPLYAVCGTPSYVAPEVIAETGYNTKVDIWSMGVIAYILLCGFPPFVSSDDNQDELFDAILAGNVDFPSPFWDNVNSSAKDMILFMLEKDQNYRLTANQVLEHVWITEDTTCNEDLHSVVSSGLTTNFRRSTHSFKQRGIQIISKTAMDNSKRCFRGRGSHVNGVK